MKNKFIKRFGALCLLVAVAVVTLCTGATTTKASDNIKLLTSTFEGTAIAGVETESYSFTTSQVFDEIYIGTTLPVAANFTIRVMRNGSEYTIGECYADDCYYNGFYYYNGINLLDVPEGTYTFSLTFDSDMEFYYTYANGYPADITISATTATITAGYTKTLSVANGTVKSWSSSKKSVATVNQNGKVTAKKAGKTTITATLEDGSKLTCKVTVKANKYTETKFTVDDVASGKSAVQVCSASFDSNGNLKLKVNVVNNTSKDYTKLSGIKITMKNSSGKTIGTYKGNKTVTVPANSSKTVTLTIKKSDLKKTSADLRNSEVTTCKATGK